MFILNYSLVVFFTNIMIVMKAIRIKNTIAIGCVIILFSILFGRVFHGFDWSDDSYYSAIAYRLVQGDPLFLTSWDIHQLSAVILFPVFWIYTKLAGTTGIILFSRVLFVTVLFIEAIGLYFKCKEKSGWIWSAFASVLLLSYESNFGLSYNTMMIESFVMSFLLLPLNNQSKYNRIRLLGCGFFSGLAVQAYPSTVITLVCFFAYFLCSKGTRHWKDVIYYICGGIITAVGFSVFLVCNSSIEALKDNVQYLLLDPEHGEFRFQVQDHFCDLNNMLGSRSAIILLISVLVAFSTWISKGKGRIFACVLSVAGIFTHIWLQWKDLFGECGQSFIQYRMFFSIAVCFPILWVLNKCKWDKCILLFLGGVLGSIGVNIATNNKSNFYVYPYIISAIATVLYAGKMLGEISNNKFVGRILVFPTIMAMAIVGFSFFASIDYVYRDAALELIDTQMLTGPASGIYTTKERAKQYEETIEAINTYMPSEGNVLYSKLLPFGYMCTEAKPATPRLWRTNLDYSMFEEYYRKNPDKKPDAIYIVNDVYGITNSGIIIGEYMQQYIESTQHEVIELNCGTIIRFSKPSHEIVLQNKEY